MLPQRPETVRTLAPGPEDADEHQERPDGVTDAPHTVILGVASGPSRAVGTPASDSSGLGCSAVANPRPPGRSHPSFVAPGAGRSPRRRLDCRPYRRYQWPRVCVCALDGPARPRYVRGLTVRQRSWDRIGDQRPARRCRAAGIIGSGRAGGKPRPLPWRMPRKPLTDTSLPLARRPGPSYAR